MDITQFLERAATCAHHNPVLKKLASQQSEEVASAFLEKNADKLKRQVFIKYQLSEASCFAHATEIFDQSNG